MIEAQVNYVIDLIRRAGAGAMIAPTEAAANAYDERIQRELQERVWAAGCGAWYVDENGRNFTLYPQNVRAFIKEMREPDMAEYEVRQMATTTPITGIN